MFFQKEKIYFGFFIYMEGIMKKEKKNNKKKGFTLIEILVVVLIIGVLAAIALPSYMRSVERSRAAGPITNLGSIAKAQKSYRMGTEHYTDNVGNLDISLKDGSNGEDATGSTFEGEFFTYKVYGDDKAVATATRKDVSEDKKYELSVDYNTNKIYCRPIENKTCIDLGLEEGQDYGSSSQGVPCNGEADADAYEGFEDYIASVGGTCNVNNGVVSYSYCDEDWCEEVSFGDNFDDVVSTSANGAFFLHTEEGVGYAYQCDDELYNGNGGCLGYDMITQYDNGAYRVCKTINGFECEEWWDWHGFTPLPDPGENSRK